MIKVDILQAWQFFWSLNCEENLQRKKGVDIQNQGKSKDAETGMVVEFLGDGVKE